MTPGYSGIFVFEWAQSVADDRPGPPPDAVRAGAVWSWRGEALRVDGPQGLLRLSGAESVRRLRQRARARIGQTWLPGPHEADDDPLLSCGFTVTNGRQAFRLARVAAPRGDLLVCHDGLPPRETELWVVKSDLSDGAPLDQPAPPLPGLSAQAMVETPGGFKRAMHLRVGDLVNTRDAGPRPIVLTTRTHISVARQMMQPEMRPYRHARAHAPLFLGPAQLCLTRDPRAAALFNTTDILVQARHDPATCVRERRLAPHTLINLVLEQHEVIWADGIALASAHPADLPLASLPMMQQRKIAELWPDVACYGPYAHRCLSLSDAALLEVA